MMEKSSLDPLTQPLTSPECDLRSFPYMALHVVQLRDSDTAALADAEAFRCAVILWCASWHQVPAASLPNEEAKLARLAGYGRDVKTFRRAWAAGAKRGWIECSDGRLYHPIVAEKANDAFAVKQNQWRRTASATASRTAKRLAQNASETVQLAESVEEPANVTCDTTCTKGEEKKGKEKKKKEEISSVPIKPTKLAPFEIRGANAQSDRGTRLPADWKPGAEHIAFAKSGGLNPSRVGVAFCDYWVSRAGAGARKANWLAAWRLWCRKDPAWREPDPAIARPSASGGPNGVVKTNGGRAISEAELFQVGT